jgi:hypothetical protein
MKADYSSMAGAKNKRVSNRKQERCKKKPGNKTRMAQAKTTVSMFLTLILSGWHNIISLPPSSELWLLLSELNIKNIMRLLIAVARRAKSNFGRESWWFLFPVVLKLVLLGDKLGTRRTAGNTDCDVVWIFCGF